MAEPGTGGPNRPFIALMSLATVALVVGLGYAILSAPSGGVDLAGHVQAALDRGGEDPGRE